MNQQHADQYPDIEPFLLESIERDHSLPIPPLPPVVAVPPTNNATTATRIRTVNDDDEYNNHTKSFIRTFLSTNGPPQIILVCVVLAFGFGSTIGVVPSITTNRYATLYHNYTGPDCTSYTTTTTTTTTTATRTRSKTQLTATDVNLDPTMTTMMIKPQACYDASADAQNGVAMEGLISNTLTFFTSAYVGSISDMYGRKPILIFGIFINSLSPLLLVLLQVDTTLSPFWYYAAGAFSGLVSWIGVALSTLSDVMPAQWRAPSYGLVLVGFSFGFAIAPQLAFLLGHWYVSLLSLGMIWFGLFIFIFCLPETLAPEFAAEAKRVRAEKLRQQTSNTAQRILYNTFYRPFWELSILNRSRLFRLLSCLAFFSGMVSSGEYVCARSEAFCCALSYCDKLTSPFTMCLLSQ
jgi:MFS family permease